MTPHGDDGKDREDTYEDQDAEPSLNAPGDAGPDGVEVDAEQGPDADGESAR
jgi:hypothetical protein